MSLYLTALLSIYLFFVSKCQADVDPYSVDEKFNNGDFGPYVTQSYLSSDARSPILNFMKPFTKCDDGSYLFVSPRGSKADAMPYILDATGSLVWTADHHYGEIYNFQAQYYKGEQYLTFWAGNDAVHGHGAGKYIMLDKHYQEYRAIEAANGIEGDLHEFLITEQGTALLTAYQVIEADLSSVRENWQEGYIWDSVFQEIDIETGEAIFQWRASEHCALTESYDPIGGKGSVADPWDFFHINSVEKDPLGNYIVSSRFLRTILYISGETGEIIWWLGGKLNSFDDTSAKGETAIDFVGQHHARWTNNYTALTFFNNRADWVETTATKSIGVRIDVNQTSMTASLAQTYSNPNADVLSVSQGSLQTLPNGNVLLGYGFNAVMTEFSPEGEVLCDAYIGEPASHFGSGDVQSYRNYKFNWTGLPLTKPSIVLRDGAFHVSWLGATEVKSWLVQHAFEVGGQYADLQWFLKDGFETSFRVLAADPVRRYVHVLALDSSGRTIGVSGLVDVADVEAFWAVHGTVQPVDDSGSEEDDDEEEDEVDGEEGEIYTPVDAELLWLIGFLATTSGIIMLFLSIPTKEEREEEQIEMGKTRYQDEPEGDRSWKSFTKLKSLISLSKNGRDEHDDQQMGLLESGSREEIEQQPPWLPEHRDSKR